MARFRTLARLTFVLALVGLIAGHASGALVDNFDPPNPAVTNTQSGPPLAAAPQPADAGSTGQFLRLVYDGTGWQGNHYSYDRTDPGQWSTITADFDFRCTSTIGGAAGDGMGMMLLPTSTYGTTGAGPTGWWGVEEPNQPGTFGVGIDLYHPSTVNDMSIHWDNVERRNVTLNSGQVNLDAALFHHASVSIQQIGNGSNVLLQVTNDVNGANSPTLTVANQYVSGLVPYDSRVHFAARSGGADFSGDLDNVNVQYSNAYVAPPTLAATTLAQDFDSLGTTLFRSVQAGSTPGPLVRTSDPNSTGNYLRLVNDKSSQANRIAFDRAFDGGVSNSLKSDFDFRMTSATWAADGMSIVFLPTATYGDSGTGASFTAENPNVADALGIGFRLHPEDSGVNDISLHWNGSQIQRVTLNPGTQIDLNAGVFHHAEVTARHVAGGSMVAVTLTPDTNGAPGAPVSVFGGEVFVAGMTPYDYRAQFAGRTGGRYVDVDLDNILSGTAPGPQPADTIQGFEGGGSQYKAYTYRTTPHPELIAGGPTGNYLRLMHSVGNQSPVVGFDASPDSVSPLKNAVYASFDYRMQADSGSERADGFGFALLGVGTYGTSGPGPDNGFGGANWERPAFPDAFAVGFDIYNNVNENTASLNWNGSQVATFFLDPNVYFNFNNDVFNHIALQLMDIGTDALATLTITSDIFGTPGSPVALFTNQLISGMDLDAFDFRVGFGGRTGGAITYVDLDNINVLIDVPEPGTMTLLALGGLGAIVRRRRRRK